MMALRRLDKAKTLTLVRVLVVFALGLICGAQTALYLYDYYDDGIADPKSLLIAIVMIVVSIGFILYLFRRKRDSGGL